MTPSSARPSSLSLALRQAARPLLAGAALLLSACDKPLAYSGPAQAGILPAAVDEASGLAASRREANLLWTHNDSGGQPVLYAVDTAGKLRGTLRIAGLKNVDWEDIAAFEFEGRKLLLIADTGDNDAARTDCALYLVDEPAADQLSPGRELTATVAWKIPVRYTDGPHDCESVAVDARANLVYLLSKRVSPIVLYSLPLRPPADGSIPLAQPVTPLKPFPQPTTTQALIPIPTGRYRAQPTAMDIAPDRSAILVLTYGDVCLFPRANGETWAQAFQKEPVILGRHNLMQAEAAAFSRDGQSIYVTTEQHDAPLLRYDLH